MEGRDGECIGDQNGMENGARDCKGRVDVSARGSCGSRDAKLTGGSLPRRHDKDDGPPRAQHTPAADIALPALDAATRPPSSSLPPPPSSNAVVRNGREPTPASDLATPAAACALRADPPQPNAGRSSVLGASVWRPFAPRLQLLPRPPTSRSRRLAPAALLFCLAPALGPTPQDGARTASRSRPRRRPPPAHVRRRREPRTWPVSPAAPSPSRYQTFQLSGGPSFSRQRARATTTWAIK